MPAKAKKKPEISVPSPHDWRTSDTDEINRRRLRALEGDFTVQNLQPRHPIFSNFRVQSGSGLSYSVEIRDVRQRQFACNCVDFRINGLGTCKHVEAVLLHLERRFRRLFRSAVQSDSPRIDILPDPEHGTLRVCNGHGPLPQPIRRDFTRDGLLKGEVGPAVEKFRSLQQDGHSEIRVSQEVEPWLRNLRQAEERKQLRREYELKVQSGDWPAHETKVPLFPYQREGMLHLAFAERALLADEMGLGKTIQAIAACALLHRLGQARRVLVVTPASLKTEWEEQIQRFTELPYQLVFGPRLRRLQHYADAPFFTIVNYEQMVIDALDVNARLQPDVVVLDEAQRIKNWDTKTAQAIKRLRSRYAFVLTGTPIENRIDELHSLMDFLNPAVLGPLFRFNREFYALNDRGRPEGYLNLDQLHARIKPYLLRRRKSDVETELPERTDSNHFVKLSPAQRDHYEDHQRIVAKLLHIAKRRPLTRQEQDKLQRELAMMRMICDTNFILDPNDRVCPKLAELKTILEECAANGEKIIVFSEWERMLQLVRELCGTLGLGFAWHTGSVPQKRRRAEINAFKEDPDCRVFLSTDSGSTGLNLQTASVVVNCDLPWNPARLEQRIARAWRKHQTRPVTVINLVAENTIEHRMLYTLAGKQALADGVLDLKGDLKRVPLSAGRQSFLAKLTQLLGPLPATPDNRPAAPTQKPLPVDRALAFAQVAAEKLQSSLVRCEERFPADANHSVLFVVVDGNPAQHTPQLNALHEELFGPGKIDPLAPVRLEVIDRATDEALQRLIDAGLIATRTRANRPLGSAAEPSGPPPLSDEERAEAAAHRTTAERKLKMAHLLGDGGLAEEARSPLLEAAHAVAHALAVEHRLPPPTELPDALRAPLSQAWPDALPLIRAFVADPNQPWPPVHAILSRLTAGQT